jgi:hypothetical protein
VNVVAHETLGVHFPDGALTALREGGQKHLTIRMFEKNCRRPIATIDEW